MSITKATLMGYTITLDWGILRLTKQRGILQMELNMAVITQENYQKDLRDFFNFDNDYNGSNGLDYVTEEAIEAGFQSDLQHDISLGLEKEKTFTNLIQFVIALYLTHQTDSFEAVSGKIEILDKNTVCVAIAYQN